MELVSDGPGSSLGEDPKTVCILTNKLTQAKSRTVKLIGIARFIVDPQGYGSFVGTTPTHLHYLGNRGNMRQYPTNRGVSPISANLRVKFLCARLMLDAWASLKRNGMC
jgi:hypothetical protein